MRKSLKKAIGSLIAAALTVSALAVVNVTSVFADVTLDGSTSFDVTAANVTVPSWLNSSTFSIPASNVMTNSNSAKVSINDLGLTSIKDTKPYYASGEGNFTISGFKGDTEIDFYWAVDNSSAKPLKDSTSSCTNATLAELEKFSEITVPSARNSDGANLSKTTVKFTATDPTKASSYTFGMGGSKVGVYKITVKYNEALNAKTNGVITTSTTGTGTLTVKDSNDNIITPKTDEVAGTSIAPGTTLTLTATPTSPANVANVKVGGFAVDLDENNEYSWEFDGSSEEVAISADFITVVPRSAITATTSLAFGDSKNYAVAGDSVDYANYFEINSASEQEKPSSENVSSIQVKGAATGSSQKTINFTIGDIGTKKAVLTVEYNTASSTESTDVSKQRTLTLYKEGSSSVTLGKTPIVNKDANVFAINIPIESGKSYSLNGSDNINIYGLTVTIGDTVPTTVITHDKYGYIVVDNTDVYVVAAIDETLAAKTKVAVTVNSKTTDNTKTTTAYKTVKAGDISFTTNGTSSASTYAVPNASGLFGFKITGVDSAKTSKVNGFTVAEAAE